MAKKKKVSLHVNNVYALVVAFATILMVSSTVVSCTKDSAFVGGIEEVYVGPSHKDSSLVVEESGFETQFDTRPAELYTVYQKVKGDKVLKEGDKEVNREHFEKSLDLKALFAHPEVVYVSNKNQLARLEETGAVGGETSVEQKNESGFIRNVLTKDFNFTLNAGEEIKASTKYEKCVCEEANKELSFTAIRNIEWDVETSKATLNKELSCEDSTVYDVVLTYKVSLTRNDYTQTKAQTINNYVVEVPYKRVYKAGNHKIADKVDENKTKRELVKNSENNYVERFTVVTYEQWSESDRVNEKVETIDVPVVFKAPEQKWIVTTNASYVTTPRGLKEGDETSRVDGNWTIKTKPFSYTSDADNKANAFTNDYSGANNAVTYQKGDIVVEFGYGEWSVEEGETTITGPKDVQYRGVTYNGYDYVNNINWTYSIKSDQYAAENKELSQPAKAHVIILIAKQPDQKVSDEVGSVKREIITDETGIKERITITTYEIWKNGGKQNEVTETREFPIVLYAPGKSQIITTSSKYTTTSQGKTEGSESSATDGHWTVKTKSFSYSSKADNGAHPFTNIYNGSSHAVVYKKGTIELRFDYGEWTIKEGKTTITGPRDFTYQGVDYDAYDYVNNIDWTYSVAKDKYATGKSTVSNSAKAEVTILIAKETDRKIAERVGDVKREIVTDNSGVKERITITTYDEMQDGRKENEETEMREFPILFKEPAKAQKITTSSNYTTTSRGTSGETETSRIDGHWTIKTKSFNYSSYADNQADPFVNTYEASSASVIYVKGAIRLEFAYGLWQINEGTTTIGARKDVMYGGQTYDGYDYVNNVNWTYTIPRDEYVESSQIAQAAKAEVEILIEKDKIVKKEGVHVQHEIVDETTDKFTWDEVETWSNGEQKTTQKEWVRYRHFKEPQKQKVYTVNKEYHTDKGTSQQLKEENSVVNGVNVTTRYMSYTAKSDNGDKSFNNVYTYDYQKGVYTDKDKMYTLTFDFPEWTFEEDKADVSLSATRDGDYAVWAHTHSIHHTYKVTYESSEQTSSGTGTALTDIYILDIPRNLPDEWGTILGLQVTAVPADDTQQKHEKYAFCLRTTTGAVAVVIEKSKGLPTIDDFTSGYFVKGTFGSEYNSAFFTTENNRHGLEVGKWAPAVGKDEDGGVSYYYKNYNVANVFSTDLHMWGGWRSVYVSGYTTTIENGVLTLTSPRGSLRLR